LVYDTIDNSNDFYRCPVEKKDRSLTNVVFRIWDKNEDLEKKFLIEASENKLVSLKWHREVWGIRASIYIPMSYEHVQRLADFMEKFQKENS
jgi:phosphoserine aminotransferase